LISRAMKVGLMAEPGRIGKNEPEKQLVLTYVSTSLAAPPRFQLSG
jgi:hypothetical protein